jgi:hypothetical protein
MKVKARISRTNRFREVTLRREPDYKIGGAGTYDKTPAYLHCGSTTVSGKAYETEIDRWVFVPNGVHKELPYKK